MAGHEVTDMVRFMERCMLRQNKTRKQRFSAGVVLTEIIITSALSLTVIMAVGVLLVGGNRAWLNTYDSAFNKTKMDALVLTTTFGNVGRKSNRLCYKIYNIQNGTFIPATPTTSDQQVISGNAVEFRYWDVDLDKSDTHDLMDPTKTATAYALFYLDGDRLKVDYGPYPPGAVPDTPQGGARNTTGATTTVLAENAKIDAASGIGLFSHTTINSVGQGCVRINIILTDPKTQETSRLTTATLLRNVWPR
jgi:hypothetical protein